MYSEAIKHKDWQVYKMVVGSDYSDCVLHYTYGSMLLDSIYLNVNKCVYFTLFWAFTGQPCARRLSTPVRSPILAATRNASSITCTGYTKQRLYQVEPMREAPHHSAMSCSASAADTSHHRCHYALKREPEGSSFVVSCSANLSCSDTLFTLQLTSCRHQWYKHLLYHSYCRSWSTTTSLHSAIQFTTHLHSLRGSEGEGSYLPKS